MTDTLDLTPRSLNLRLYAGDDPTLTLLFWTDTTKTVRRDLSAFTGWGATIRTAGGDTAAFAIDTSDAATGAIVLSLDGDDIRSFPSKGCRWDLKALDADSQEVTWVRGRVTVKPDVTV